MPHVVLTDDDELFRESLGLNRPQVPLMQVRIVLLTDGLLDIDPATAEKIQKQLSEAPARRFASM